MLAQNLDQIQSQGLPGFTGGANIGQFISNSKILNYIFGAAALMLLVFIVMGGLQLMLSRGEPKAIQAAQGKITNAVIGFFIVIIAALLVSLIGRIFGLSVFGNIFG
jgi:hypothetical protein